MQQAQFNVFKRGALLVLLMAVPAAAGTMAKPHQSDPLLDGGPTSPCMAGPDYQAGMDVNGRPIAPADEQASRVPVPDEISVPLHTGRTQSHRPGRPNAAPPAQPGESPYIALDGSRLDPLLNPKPCH